MEVIAIAGSAVGATGFLFGLLFGWRLYRWEKQLRGAKLAIAFKGRVKMSPTIHDLLKWALVLDRDKRNTGQAFFRMGGTTVAILKPTPKHGKATVKTVKDTKAA